MRINDLALSFLGHAGFLIETETKKIAIDPYNLSNAVPKVDLILITHSHYDHCSIKDIEKVSRDGTIIIIPADAQSKITKVNNVNMQIIEIGEEISFDSIKVEAIPSYNVNKDYHPKREGWLGYIVKTKDVIIYHSGDTDKIPEMSRLTGYGKHGNQFVALLPVSGTYVMDADEAAEVASLISPDLAIPMHYGAGVVGELQDAERFVKLCTQLGVNAKILEKI